MNTPLRVPELRAVMVGSGARGLNSPGNEFTRAALELSGVSKPTVLTIGTAEPTAEYFEEFKATAAARFSQLGAKVVNLHDFGQKPTRADAQKLIREDRPDVIWVAGGDTDRMVASWREKYDDDTSLSTFLHEAAARGTVMGGGSAGMLAWLEAGHSDSLSYRVAEGEPWEYIFVRGMGYIAVTGCPHYDAATDGGAPRETDFAERFMRDDTVPSLAIGIDNMAAGILAEGRLSALAAPDADYPRAGVHLLQKTEAGLSSHRLPNGPNGVAVAELFA